MDVHNILIALSKSKLNEDEIKNIEEYLKKNTDLDFLIGQLMFHKLLCRAYKHFIINHWLRFLPSSIVHPLRKYYDLNEYKRKLSEPLFADLLDELDSSKVQYCILKGLPLEKDLFGDSVREYKDTDLLIHIRDLEIVNMLLIKLGYNRGVYNGELDKIERDRSMDVFFMMNTHQTLPYVKLTQDLLFKIDIIDLQFSFTLQKALEYKLDLDTVMQNRSLIEIYKRDCYTLSIFDNFIMLCTHLYGEAVLIQEIKKYKDLQLIKFADIYEWIEKYYKMFDWNDKRRYIIEAGFLKPVLYCVYIVAIIYESVFAKNIYELMQNHDLSFLDEYRDENFEVKKWKMPLMERLFKIDKLDML